MIIDEKMIRDQIVAHEKCDETCPGLELRGKDVVETLEKLWRVARAAEELIARARLMCVYESKPGAPPALYDVRSLSNALSALHAEEER